jgi:hypothetical protein
MDKQLRLSILFRLILCCYEDSKYEFLFMLNKISVPTRYPEDLRKLVAAYSKERTDNILNRTKEIQLWIKQQ